MDDDQRFVGGVDGEMAERVSFYFVNRSYVAESLIKPFFSLIVRYWDDWMREPAQRKNRACIRPEISRTSTFGKEGVSL